MFCFKGFSGRLIRREDNILRVIGIMKHDVRDEGSE